MNKYFFIGILGGFIVGLGLGTGYKANPTFKVGDCVRTLGYQTSNKITYITIDGGVELQWYNVYSNKYELEGPRELKNLIKISCEGYGPK